MVFFISNNLKLKDLFVEVIVKASSGPRYVVGCRSKVDKEKLTSGTRVVLDMTTLTIMRTLPREVWFSYADQFLSPFVGALFSNCFVLQSICYI